MSDDKKPSRRLGYGLAILRHLQWFSALLASFGLVKLHGDVVPGTKGRKIDVIPYLDSALLFYSLFLLGYVLYCSLARRLGKAWFAWGVVSVSGDFHMIGLLLAKLIIIGSSKLPEKCHDVIREKYFQNELRDHHPFRELAKSIFRIGSFMGRDEVDQQCYTSFVVFWLSALTIITYILSIILTIVRLHKYRKALNSPVEADGSGSDTEMAMETTAASIVGRVSRHLSRSRASSVGSNANSTKKDKSHPNNTPPPSYRSRLSQETTWSYHANLATVSDGFSAGEPPSAPRVSMETTYSVAVNRCLVSDGFGQREQLPEYSSRPASPVRYPGT